MNISTRDRLKNNNGKTNYNSSTVVDYGAGIPWEDITLLKLEEGLWEARVKMSRVIQTTPVYNVQKITVNNTTNYPGVYNRRGERVQGSVTETTRKVITLDKHGNIIDAREGNGSVTKTVRNWDGRSGSTQSVTTPTRPGTRLSTIRYW